MRFRLETAVFLSGAALMGLEIAGSRVLAPVFGTSVFVWGSLITTFLAALALGYAAGGKLADARPDPAVLSNVLTGSGLLLWLLFVRPDPLLDLLASVPVPDRFRALLAALALFAVPSVLMGAVTPFAVRLCARDVATVGSSAGRLSAISTAGSILGTFAMTFFLIPAFALPPILFGLGATLVVAGLVCVPRPSLARVATLAAATVAGGSVYLLGTAEPASPVPGGKVVFQKETAYHRIRVVDQGLRRALYFDNRLQGWIGRLGAEETGLNYVDGLLAGLALRRSPTRSAVLIGLGPGMLPTIVGARQPGLAMTSIEIDPEVVRVAERYFGFRPDANDRVIVGDGRRELERQVPETDALFQDAYFADSIPFHLVTREYFELCFRKLSADGVLAANFGGLLTGEGNALFWSAYRTVEKVFPRVYVLCPELSQGKGTFASTAVLVAAKDPVRRTREEILERAVAVAEDLGRPAVADWAGFLYDGEVFGVDLPVLTDAYSPTDALQHLRRR